MSHKRTQILAAKWLCDCTRSGLPSSIRVPGCSVSHSCHAFIYRRALVYTDRRRRQSSQAPALESSCSAHSTGSPRTYRKCAGAQLFCFRAVRRAPFVEHARCNTAPLEHTAATHLNFLRNPLSPRGTNPPPLVKQMNLFCAAAFPL